MKRPATPLNEEARLKALESYKIMDTLPEKDYDDITGIASLICNTPIALVSLIDADRQFFKSRLGLADSGTSREFAFCAHAINHPKELMIVKDSRKDERFSDNPLVTGHPRVIFYAGMPLVTPDGYALGTLCVIDNKFKDLSEEQKKALKSLANQVVHLLELRKKNELLIMSQNALASFAREMEAFAYAASHDLKEPLRMVKSFIHLLEKKYAAGLDDTARKYIQFAADGSNRMETLINDLLEYSRAGRINTDTGETDLNGIMDEVRGIYRLAIKENSVTLDCTDLPTLKISPVAILQVFQNLVGNAIKFQVKDAKPIISVKVTETKTRWQFSVTDNGIGISQDNLESIFTIFKRLHSKEEYPGTGMGLSICKKIVTQHGGEIWAESEEGKGSVFYFTLLK
jgi:signal transduction histidine kinase